MLSSWGPLMERARKQWGVVLSPPAQTPHVGIWGVIIWRCRWVGTYRTCVCGSIHVNTHAHTQSLDLLHRCQTAASRCWPLRWWWPASERSGLRAGPTQTLTGWKTGSAAPPASPQPRPGCFRSSGTTSGLNEPKKIRSYQSRVNIFSCFMRSEHLKFGKSTEGQLCHLQLWHGCLPFLSTGSVGSLETMATVSAGLLWETRPGTRAEASILPAGEKRHFQKLHLWKSYHLYYISKKLIWTRGNKIREF